jgi:tetratricopeptide (TPR) repeat protein
MTRNISWIIVVSALSAIAVWPMVVRQREDVARAASYPTPAPVDADYLLRDRTIAFWEGMVRKHLTEDMLSPRQLSMQYLQRYRERGDIGDVLRARSMAERSLAEQPRGNVGAEVALASVELTLHQFKAALGQTKQIERLVAGDSEMMPSMRVREASLDLEIGDYSSAKHIIDKLPSQTDDIARDTLVARYEELTGHLAAARELLERPTAEEDSLVEAPAQQRAWFHFRSGEMAFEAGDNEAAIADERQALELFPNYSEANRLLAKFSCALKRWQECRTAAAASANVVPYPETLGYEEDADRALGQIPDADRTRDLIVTIEKIGNAQHISDRLLAIYYSEHRIRTADAYAIARRELTVRDDIFTEDTLAWVAAMDGRWNEARIASRKALHYDTENTLLLYHAGIIALHFGDRDEARRRLATALALNPSFHPLYADDARIQLSKLSN